VLHETRREIRTRERDTALEGEKGGRKLGETLLTELVKLLHRGIIR
jgi:hypothetical protein